MSGLDLVLVAVGGAAGASSRHLVVGWAQRALGATPTGGTVLVNVVGSFVLGLVAAVVASGGPGWVLALVGAGWCGAFTTFSSHAVEVAAALRAGRARVAVVNLAVSLIGCLLVVVLGWTLGSALA